MLSLSHLHFLPLEEELFTTHITQTFLKSVTPLTAESPFHLLYISILAFTSGISNLILSILIVKSARILSFQFLKPSRYVPNSFLRYFHFLKIKSAISLHSCGTDRQYNFLAFISLGTQQSQNN